MPETFYALRGDGRVGSTERTTGPWSPDAQHFGPPAALLTRALEQCEGGTEMALGRITIEILGPVPVADLQFSAQIERPGKKVQLLSATLGSEDKTLARASAWRFARTDTSEQRAGAAPALEPVGNGTPFDRPDGWGPGYIDAMEWVSITGSLGEAGPAVNWVRQRFPLVEGEQPSPLQRLMAVVDSASGVSSWLDPSRWLFINTELTVHVQREPVGEWIGLDAKTTIGPNGAGTATSVVHDAHGQVANSAQALLVQPR